VLRRADASNSAASGGGSALGAAITWLLGLCGIRGGIRGLAPEWYQWVVERSQHACLVLPPGHGLRNRCTLLINYHMRE
jgi:hypothetical protein